MEISIVKLYEETGTDSEINALLPVTSNLDGLYRGEAMINFVLLMTLSSYRDAEENQMLQELEEYTDQSNAKNWLKVTNIFNSFNKESEEDREYAEYGLQVSKEKGYVEIEFWDGYRYFKPTAKCMNLDLYKHRKHM